MAYPGTSKLSSPLASHRQQLTHTRSVLDDNSRQSRLLENRVGDFRQKISKLQDQMNGARTNEQFRAFQHEIQYCRDGIDELEERILDKMEQAEALQESVAKAEADLRGESTKVSHDVEVARARIDADKIERERQRAIRNEVSAQIDPETLREYERIRKARGTAVTSVARETCGACHVRLRPKFLQDLRRLSRGVLTCESCGLIVYLPSQAEDDVPLEHPAGDSAGKFGVA